MVEDVAFHCQHVEMFGSVGDDRKLMIWDKRSSDGKPHEAVVLILPSPSK